MYWGITSLVPLLAATSYGLLLFIVLRTRPQTRALRAFELYLTGMFTWAAASFLAHSGVGTTVLLFKVMLGASTLAALSNLRFVTITLDREHKLYDLLYGIGLLVILFVLFGNQIIKYAHVHNGILDYEFGPGVIAIFIVALPTIVLTLSALIRAYRQAISRTERNRIKYLLVGLGLVLSMLPLNFTPLGSYPFDLAANTLNAWLITYVIIRYELLDLGLVVRKSLAYTALLLAIAATYFIPLIIFELYAHPTGFQLHSLGILLTVLVVIGMAASVQPVYAFTRNRVDRLFFRERYNAYHMVQELGHQLATTLDLDQLVIIVLDRLFETIPMTALNFFLRDDASGEFYLTAGRGSGLDPIRWRANHPIVRWLKQEKCILAQRTLNISPRFLGLWEQERQELNHLNGDLFIPLRAKDNLVGLLIVGKKLSQESYSADDNSFLATLASQVAVGIENARLYKQAHQELSERKRMEAALLQSEEYFRALIENAMDIVIVLNEEGTILYESPSFERVLGYPSRDLIGHSFYQFLHIEDQYSFIETLQYKSHDLRPGPATEIRVRHKDGAWRTIEAVSNNLLNDPVTAGIVVNLRDITERKYLEEQLRLAQKMEAVGRLAGGVAHDFNNILTIITGYSDLLLRRLEADDVIFKPIAEIGKAADRASGLTRQLLAFSRKQIIHPQVINLNRIVTNMDNMLRRLIGEDIELITILEPDLRPVRADVSQIEQVIMNLAVNARDAMPKGGEIIIRTANADLDPLYTQYQVDLKPGPYILLALTDTGQGIDEHTQDHIFEPFFSTKEQGKGTGLGLATIYGIVQQSEGHIEVESEPGWGTRFNIYLPQTMDQPETPETLQLPDVSLQGSETILLVEDEPSVRQLTCKILVENGYTVLTAADSQEALKLSERYAAPIDLLLTDVVMPGGMSGRDLANHLTLQRPQTKTLFMSGYTDDAIVHHGVLEPGLAFLPKPFTSVGLARSVREALG